MEPFQEAHGGVQEAVIQALETATSSMENNGDIESERGEKKERNGSAIEDRDMTLMLVSGGNNGSMAIRGGGDMMVSCRKVSMVVDGSSRQWWRKLGQLGKWDPFENYNSGKSWSRDKAANDIAANLYSVKFINERQGFVLGNDGVLLKYLG
ncbi:hypothetical protein L1987_04226 [Smallanthus sonchifolius]|uniref:Uncharacterized protein n=1 Tax=Smallanthus sonchifolius TaxID=185202 RepID=A0ACB9KD02_9ASTR|nr:hypothetical protein L1987_04226 [Smallanthus sonchifolius]